MSGLILGEAAPWFIGRTPSIPRFAFSSAAGRYVLMIFAPRRGPEADLAMATIRAHRDQLDDQTCAAFVVLQDPQAIAAARDEAPGLRFFLDPAGEISTAYGVSEPCVGQRPLWMLLDPTLRLMTVGPIGALAAAFQKLASLGEPATHAGSSMSAPVLVVPRIFEPELCRRLIDHYEAVGGAQSGVMRQIDGRTVGMMDSAKRRRDADIADEDLRNGLAARLRRRLLPQIHRAFQFEATRIERYIVACYDAAEGGWFRSHRDNTTLGTAHRRFACTINLNAEDFEGGDLRFPEYGRQTYRAPTGGAVIFSCSLLHEATPVTRGRRHAFLTFFYDEAAAQVRQANLQTLVQSTAAERPAAEHVEA